MPAITIQDLENAKADVDHIAAVATSLSPTATDRLGHVKQTLAGAVGSIAAITDRGAWASGAAYLVKDLVTVGGIVYVCVLGHTASATFAGDSAKWRAYQGSTAETVGIGGGRTQADKNAEIVSVLDFAHLVTDPDDWEPAFTGAWEYVRSSLVNTTNMPHVSRRIVIPPREYNVSTSINWTRLIAWNIHVEGNGAVINSKVQGKAVIDAIGVRGLHISGLYISSDDTNIPLCGLLIGPIGTSTCGNNRLTDVKIFGKYSTAPYINIGSETTRHDNCYFAQTLVDTSNYAAVADGSLIVPGIVSDYQSIRAYGTGVSFTDNVFSGCHFRNYSNAAHDDSGSSLFICSAVNWEFDKGCYFLSYGKSAIDIYCPSIRNVGVSIKGSFETNFDPGLDTAVTFIVPNGATTGLLDFEFQTTAPLCSNSVFNVVSESGGVTTGTLNLAQSRITITGRNGTSMLFDAANCGTLIFSGDIRYRDSAGLNLFDINKMLGTVYTVNGASISGAVGSKIFNFILFDETTSSGRLLRFSGAGPNYVAVNTGTVPEVRAEGTGTDVDLMLRGKGTGYVRFGTRTATSDVAITGYIEIKDAAGAVRKLAVIP